MSIATRTDHTHLLPTLCCNVTRGLHVEVPLCAARRHFVCVCKGGDKKRKGDVCVCVCLLSLSLSTRSRTRSRLDSRWLLLLSSSPLSHTHTHNCAPHHSGHLYHRNRALGTTSFMQSHGSSTAIFAPTTKHTQHQASKPSAHKTTSKKEVIRPPTHTNTTTSQDHTHTHTLSTTRISTRHVHQRGQQQY